MVALLALLGCARSGVQVRGLPPSEYHVVVRVVDASRETVSCQDLYLDEDGLSTSLVNVASRSVWVRFDHARRDALHLRVGVQPSELADTWVVVTPKAPGSIRLDRNTSLVFAIGDDPTLDHGTRCEN